MAEDLIRLLLAVVRQVLEHAGHERQERLETIAPSAQHQHAQGCGGRHLQTRVDGYQHLKTVCGGYPQQLAILVPDQPRPVTVATEWSAPKACARRRGTHSSSSTRTPRR